MNDLYAMDLFQEWLHKLLKKNRNSEQSSPNAAAWECGKPHANRASCPEIPWRVGDFEWEKKAIQGNPFDCFT